MLSPSQKRPSWVLSCGPVVLTKCHFPAKRAHQLRGEKGIFQVRGSNCKLQEVGTSTDNNKLATGGAEVVVVEGE